MYTDRTLEILKLKLKIPSKFENDNRLKNRLQVKQNDHQLTVNDKLRLAARLSVKNLEKNQIYYDQKNAPKNTHIFLKDNDSDQASFVSEYSYDKNEVKKEEKEKEFGLERNSEVFLNLFDDNNKNEDDDVVEVKVVVDVESEEEEDDDDEDIDSKCVQFDRYRKGPKSKRVKTFQDEIIEMEEKYREVRDERNKLSKNLKKKKKKKDELDDLNATCEALHDEMKEIRITLKKLRKNSRIESRRNYKQRKKRNDF